MTSKILKFNLSLVEITFFHTLQNNNIIDVHIDHVVFKEYVNSL